MYISNINYTSGNKINIDTLPISPELIDTFKNDGFSTYSHSSLSSGEMLVEPLAEHSNSNYFIFTSLSLWSVDSCIPNSVIDPSHTLFLEVANALSATKNQKKHFDLMIGNGCSGATVLTERAINYLHSHPEDTVTCGVIEKNQNDNFRVAPDYSFISSDMACTYDVSPTQGDWKIISTVRATDTSLVNIDIKKESLKYLVTFASLCREAKRKVEADSGFMISDIDYAITENLHSESLMSLKNALGLKISILNQSKARYGHTFNADTIITLDMNKNNIQSGERVLLVDHSIYNVNLTLVEKV